MGFRGCRLDGLAAVGFSKEALEIGNEVRLVSYFDVDCAVRPTIGFGRFLGAGSFDESSSQPVPMASQARHKRCPKLGNRFAERGPYLMGRG
jgi:hypothetical protein